MIFNLNDLSVANYSDGFFKLDKNVEVGNGGGLIQYETQSGVFDMGFAYSNVAYVDPDRESTWRIKKSFCNIPNSELFDYSDPDEPNWTLKNEAHLITVLKKYNCPLN
ncbi:MAG: hypothetical protein R2827_04180 [Bdellovibrionales bacterium]